MTDVLLPALAASSDPGAGPIDERLVCTHVADVTHDVKSFTLARADGSPLAFDPGQYLTFTVATDRGEPASQESTSDTVMSAISTVMTR